MLTETQFIAAKDFIYKSARPLDIATFEYEFKDGERTKVIDILSSYQNPDGGFGNSLEPDIRLPSSSVMATTVGLQYLIDLNVDKTNPILQSSMN